MRARMLVLAVLSVLAAVPVRAADPAPARPPGPDFASELIDVRARAERGSAEDQYRLAQMHQTGLGTPISYPDYRAWLLKAAETGHPYAQVEAATNLELGLYGMRKDPVQAFAWNLRAARQGMPPAYAKVAKAYALGQGTPVNKPEAYFWELAIFNYDTQRMAKYNVGNPPSPQNQGMVNYLTEILKEENAALASYRRDLTPEQEADTKARAAAFLPKPEI